MSELLFTVFFLRIEQAQPMPFQPCYARLIKMCSVDLVMEQDEFS